MVQSMSLVKAETQGSHQKILPAKSPHPVQLSPRATDSILVSNNAHMVYKPCVGAISVCMCARVTLQYSFTTVDVAWFKGW